MILTEWMAFRWGCRLSTPLFLFLCGGLMHLKCIHELCIALLIFQSCLHHIRVVSLFYIDFGDISHFSFFLELTLHCQKILFFLYFDVLGTQTTSKSPQILRGSVFGRKKEYKSRKSKKESLRIKRGRPTRLDSLAAWGAPSCPSSLRCCPF
jgi:hypothetical protein